MVLKVPAEKIYDTGIFIMNMVITIRHDVENVTSGIRKIFDWWVLLCVQYNRICKQWNPLQPWSLYCSQNMELLTSGLRKEGIQLRKKNNPKDHPESIVSFLPGGKIFPRKRHTLYNNYIFPCLPFFSSGKFLNQLLNWLEMLMSLKRYVCIYFTYIEIKKKMLWLKWSLAEEQLLRSYELICRDLELPLQF